MASPASPSQQLHLGDLGATTGRGDWCRVSSEFEGMALRNPGDHTPSLFPKYPWSLVQAISCYPFTWAGGWVLNLALPKPGCQEPDPFILVVQWQLCVELLCTQHWAPRTPQGAPLPGTSCHITFTGWYDQQGTDAKDRNKGAWLCQES